VPPSTLTVSSKDSLLRAKKMRPPSSTSSSAPCLSPYAYELELILRLSRSAPTDKGTKHAAFLEGFVQSSARLSVVIAPVRAEYGTEKRLSRSSVTVLRSSSRTDLPFLLSPPFSSTTPTELLRTLLPSASKLFLCTSATDDAAERLSKPLLTAANKVVLLETENGAETSFFSSSFERVRLDGGLFAEKSLDYGAAAEVRQAKAVNHQKTLEKYSPPGRRAAEENGHKVRFSRNVLPLFCSSLPLRRNVVLIAFPPNSRSNLLFLRNLSALPVLSNPPTSSSRGRSRVGITTSRPATMPTAPARTRMSIRSRKRSGRSSLVTSRGRSAQRRGTTGTANGERLATWGTSASCPSLFSRKKRRD
jgi:hypothetical protein